MPNLVRSAVEALDRALIRAVSVGSSSFRETLNDGYDGREDDVSQGLSGAWLFLAVVTTMPFVWIDAPGWPMAIAASVAFALPVTLAVHHGVIRGFWRDAREPSMLTDVLLVLVFTLAMISGVAIFKP